MGASSTECRWRSMSGKNRTFEMTSYNSTTSWIKQFSLSCDRIWVLVLLFIFTGNDIVFRERWSRRSDRSQDWLTGNNGHYLLGVDGFHVIVLLSDSCHFNTQYLYDVILPILNQNISRFRVNYKYLPWLIRMDNTSSHTLTPSHLHTITPSHHHILTPSHPHTTQASVQKLESYDFEQKPYLWFLFIRMY
jgi:hypothetical protein